MVFHLLALDVEEMLANGQYHAAVLPLPPCLSKSGCRAVVRKPDDGSRDFNIPELFHITTEVCCCILGCSPPTTRREWRSVYRAHFL